MPVTSQLTRLLLVLLALASVHPLASPRVEAGIMTNDPQGFHGFVWGTSMVESDQLARVDSGFAIAGYAFKSGTPRLGDVPVDSIRLFTVDGKFARVVIRYQGQKIHDQVMAHLQQSFGPIDRTPGQLARRLNEQYNWRGTDTEINLTYQAASERGYIFFESRTLAPRFNEYITDTGE